SQVVDVLVALLQAPLRTAEVGASSGSVRKDHSRLARVIGSLGDKPCENEAGFVGDRGPDRPYMANVQIDIVDMAGRKAIRSNIGSGLDNDVARPEPVRRVANGKH